MSKVVVIGCAVAERDQLRLGAANLQRVWAGLKPVTRDGIPIVEATGARNLIVATGHHRKGILLAPLAAMQVASLIS